MPASISTRLVAGVPLVDAENQRLFAAGAETASTVVVAAAACSRTVLLASVARCLSSCYRDTNKQMLPCEVRNFFAGNGPTQCDTCGLKNEKGKTPSLDFYAGNRA
jgi:hypothetical protein